MSDYLIFSFDNNGCIITIERSGNKQVLALLSPHSCLNLGIDIKKLIGFMHFGTEISFFLSGEEEAEKTPIPPGIIKAFEEE